MLEGVYVDKVMEHAFHYQEPYKPIAPAGVLFGSESIYRYSLRESTYPTLSIVDSIKDKDGELIPPGHYELAISDDKDFFILMQSKNPIAIIPVFKVEIEVSETPETKDKKALKKEEKEAKKIAQTNKKRERAGMPPVNNDNDIYQEASIEYIKEGGYYLIRYERGDVKAWGAIKD